MKKIYPYALTLALLSSGAVYGSAQSAPSAQPLVKAFFQEHETLGRRTETGARNGLPGWTARRTRDIDHHRPFRSERGLPKSADQGYEDRFGDRDRYQEEYRKAYERGYREGYHHDEPEFIYSGCDVPIREGSGACNRAFLQITWSQISPTESLTLAVVTHIGNCDQMAFDPSGSVPFESESSS